MKSIFQSSSQNSVISKDQVQILRNWNNAVAHGCTNQETFNRIIANADDNTKMYFAGLNKGKGSIEGLKNAQNVAKQSTIGLTIAQTALNMAISMGLMAAISLAIKGFDKLVNSAKRASEAADEAFSDTNEKVQQNEEEAKSLDELISKYKELKESGNLDIDGRKEVKELQNDIADLVGTQAKNLDLVNGKLDEEIEKLNKISAKEAKDAYETATANYFNSQKANKNAAGDDSYVFFDGYAYVGKKEKEPIKILQDAGFNNAVQTGGLNPFNQQVFVMDTFDNDFKELKGAQEKADYLQSMIDVLEQNGQRATDLYAGLIKQRDAYLKYIDNQQNAANSLVNSWITYNQFSNEELSKINVDSVESFDTYRQKMIEEAKNDESIGKILADGTLSDEDLEKAVNDFMATSLNFSKWYEQWLGNVQGSTSEHKTDISTLKTDVEKAKKSFTDLQVIMSESVSGTGISDENLKAFREMFGDDAEKALEKTANGYHLNKKALEELQKQQNQSTKSKYLSSLSNQLTELRDIESQIAASELLGKDISGLEASRNGILENISSLKDLQYQYESATSAYQQWQNAMSGGEEGDMYDAIYGNIEDVQDLYNKGLIGTNKFQEFVDLMSSQDLSTASTEQIVAAYEAAIPKIQRYFTEGQQGAQNFLYDIQSINSEWAHMNDDGSWEINFGVGNDKEAADALGIDVEALQAMLKKLKDYGANVNLDQPIDSLDTLKNKAQSAKESLEGMGEKININVDANKLTDVDSQITSITDYIQNISNSDIPLDVKTDKIDYANEILEYLIAKKQELCETEEVDVLVNVDETKLDAAYGMLNDLKTYLEEDHTLGISLNQDKIDMCVSMIEKLTPEIKVALGIQGMSIEEIKSGLLDGTIQIPIEVQSDKAKKDVDDVNNKNIEEKKLKISTDPVTLESKKILDSIAVTLSGLKDKNVRVTVTKTENAIPSLGGVQKVQGTAYAGGKWNNAKGGKTLVGELGTEIVVDPHTGRWYTVGDNGTEFVQMPENAIVFNHLQSESLLKNGSIIGRGNALAGGTAMSSSNPFRFYNGSGSSSSGSGNSSGESSSGESGSAEKASDNFVDFIEILLTRTKEITTKLTDAIEDAVSLTDKMNKNSSAIAQTQKEISVNQQAYAKYISLSNSVGLDEGYASQIRNGSLNIENITDEDLKKKVDEYKKWYEAAIKCQDTITSLQKEEKKLAQNRLEYIESYYDAIVKLNDAYKDVNDAHLEYLDAIGSSAVSDTVKGYYQNSYNKQYDSYNKALQQLADYQNEFNKLVRDGYIKNGSEAWYDGQQKIQEFTKQVDESATALIELEDKINEIEFTKLQQIIDGYDRRKEQLTNAQSLAESRNILIGRGEYQKQIDVLSKSIDSTYALRDKKLKEQNLYDISSTRYQELAKEIAELDNDIYGQLEDIEELKDKIFEAEFFNYEKEQENLEYFIGELNDFADLLNEDGFFDKSGAFTDEAYAKIALVADAMNKTKQETANATEALKKLSEMYENSLISETEYSEKQKELLNLIRDSVGATEDYKNELLDLYTTQIQKENESLKKNISLRKEALKNAKDYNDYADSLKSKTKSVNELEARINALQGVNNSAAKSELKRLQAQLEDANKELSDTKKDHEYDMISEGYDLMSDNLDESIESIEYSISHSTDKQLEVVQSMLSQMVGSYKDAFSKISSIISNTGFVGSGSFNGTVSNVGTSSGSSSIANGATQSQSSVRPDGSATGINSSNINNGNNASIENEISKEPNTTNRLCAELKISKTSVSVQEGSQVSLTVSIRPNDAKNKTISWVSDKPSIASVTSDGKITGVKPGTTTITAWTTDGSGLHQSCKVTVTKKPEPPKPPQPVKPNQPSSVPQGNGVPDVGDRVTYVSGIYHEDSYGNGNWGNWGLGQSAYITSMNPNSPYPIHISTGNRLGSGDRGWLRLDQLRGYRNGAKRIDEDQVAWTQEYGNEFVARAKDGAILTRLGAGDTVFTNEQVRNLWEQSKYKPDVSSFVKENVYKSLGIQPSFSQNEVRQNMEINLHFDSLLQIQGNVSKDAIPGLKKEIDKMIPHISDQLGIFLKKELKKM